MGGGISVLQQARVCTSTSVNSPITRAAISAFWCGGFKLLKRLGYFQQAAFKQVTLSEIQLSTCFYRLLLLCINSVCGFYHPWKLICMIIFLFFIRWTSRGHKSSVSNSNVRDSAERFNWRMTFIIAVCILGRVKHCLCNIQYIDTQRGRKRLIHLSVFIKSVCLFACN